LLLAQHSPSVTLTLTPHFLFFLTIPPPPTSTLFPYTTLFRSELPDARRARGLERRPRPQDVVLHRLQQVEFHKGHMLEGGSVEQDRKSTRLNSSHGSISYAVFCLKKKKNVSPPKQNTMFSRTH